MSNRSHRAPGANVVAQTIVKSIMKDDDASVIDYTDHRFNPVISGSDHESSFTLIKEVNDKIHGHKGPGGTIPLGRFEYDVKVTRKWVSYDDEVKFCHEQRR